MKQIKHSGEKQKKISSKEICDLLGAKKIIKIGNNEPILYDDYKGSFLKRLKNKEFAQEYINTAYEDENPDLLNLAIKEVYKAIGL